LARVAPLHTSTTRRMPRSARNVKATRRVVADNRSEAKSRSNMSTEKIKALATILRNKCPEGNSKAMLTAAHAEKNKRKRTK
jgi:hypothetical protein